MRLFRIARAHRLSLGLLAAVLATIAAGLFAGARAQGRVCRTIDNITVCGDQLAVESADGKLVLKGNITMGPRSGSQVLKVRDVVRDGEGDSYSLFVYGTSDEHRRLYGAPAVLAGTPCLTRADGSGGIYECGVTSREAENTAIPGYFFVDTAAQKVVLPRQEQVGFYTIGKLKRLDVYDFPLIAFAGLSPFGEPQYDAIEYELDLRRGVLTAAVPLKLNLPTSIELTVDTAIARLTFEAGGQRYQRRLEGLQARVAGMQARFVDVDLLDPFGDAPPAGGEQGAAFRAGLVEFRKADNPDLPNLDPSDPGLIFRVEGVEYRNGRLSVSGGRSIRDWEFGNAFKLTDQRISLGLNQLTDSYQFTISSTLSFGGTGASVSDTTRYPVILTVAAQRTAGGIKPLIRGTMGAAQPNLGLGPLRIKPQGVGLEFNAITNFYGLTADRVALQWNSQTGGQSGPALSGFRLGVDRDKNLVFNLGGGADLDLPEFRSAVLSGKLRGSIVARENVLTASLSGTMGIVIKGNTGAAPTVSLTLRSGRGVQSSCAPGSAGCLPAYAMSLSGFELKLAGFSIALSDVRGQDGGGIAAGRAVLRVPAGIAIIGGAGGELRNFRISGAGSVSIDGGGIELPTLRVGGFEFASARGFFAKTTTDYEFRAMAVVPLPGVSSAGSDKKLMAGLTFRLRPDGSFLGAGARLEFNTGSPGIPLGTTGMELRRISGSFETNSGRSTISVTMRAVSQRTLKGLALATVDGTAELQLKPFKLTANARLSLLVFEVARASVGIGAGQGFNGADGFNVQATVDLKVAHGELLLRMGRLTLSDGTRRVSVAIKVKAEVGIKKSQFGRLLPPRDLTLGSIELKGGDFKVKNKGDALGVMGSVKCCIFFSASFFIDLSNGDVSMVNAENYKLIGGDTIRALAAQNVPGFSSRALDTAALAALVGPEEAGAAFAAPAGLAAAPDAVRVIETVPITVTSRGGAFFGIAYPEGAPSILVRAPDGTTYSRATVDNVNAAYIEEVSASEGGRDQALLLKDAQPGVYTMLIVEPPASYEHISYSLNAAPTLSRVRFDCGSFDESPLVDTGCDGTPVGDGVMVTYVVGDTQTEGLRVYAGLAPLREDGSADTTSLWAVSEGLKIGRGSAYLATTGVPSGRYRVLIGVNDGANAPVEQLSDLVVTVEDRQPPAAPRYMLGMTGPGMVMARWEASASRDVAGYELGCGPTPDPATFAYVRDLGGLGEAAQDEDGLLPATVWGLRDGQQVYYSVRAYDHDGNVSAWAPVATQKTWPVAPEAFSPLPGGQAYPDSTIRLMFDTPLDAQTLAGRLALRDGAGASVPGRAEVITDLGGTQALGLRFTPDAPLGVGAQYEVVVEGGGGGIMTADGRSMPQDYRWTFSVVAPGAEGGEALVPPEAAAPEAPPEEGGIPDGGLGDPEGWRVYLPLLAR